MATGNSPSGDSSPSPSPRGPKFPVPILVNTVGAWVRPIPVPERGLYHAGIPSLFQRHSHSPWKSIAKKSAGAEQIEHHEIPIASNTKAKPFQHVLHTSSNSQMDLAAHRSRRQEHRYTYIIALTDGSSNTLNGPRVSSRYSKGLKKWSKESEE